MRGSLEFRKALGLFSLFLFLLLLGFAPFHQVAGHQGGGHDPARCAICLASAHLIGLVIALIIFPYSLPPFFRGFFCYIPLKPHSVASRLPPARAPPISSD